MQRLQEEAEQGVVVFEELEVVDLPELRKVEVLDNQAFIPTLYALFKVTK